MKTSIKKLLMAIAASAVLASTAHAASGDLLVGFEHGSGNTYVFNLGQFSTLSNGQQWNLGSQLAAAGFNVSTPGSGVNFGVIGYNNLNSTLYSTLSLADSASDYNSAKASVNTMNANDHTQLYGSGLDWFSQTENPILVGGNWTAATGQNPNTTQPGAATLNSYALDSSSTASYFDFTLGTDGTLTYGIVAAPEPSTYGLMAGLGLLMLAFRRKSFKA
ncbi:MAG: hypothetical protein JWR69_1990 [Pedosphaera sp.]|nr:hypothetical protein [Pedosphaera sp.]